jgi:hypothetical protein
MRSVVLFLLAAALGGASAFVVACGDRSDLIPRGEAAAIESDLDEASALYDREECRLSQAAVRRARSRADELPPEVDADLRAALSDNLDHALDRVVAECGRRRRTQTTATTPTTVAPTTATQPTTTETQPTTTTDELEPERTVTTDEPETPPPPDPGVSGGTPSGGDNGGRGGGRGPED